MTHRNRFFLPACFLAVSLAASLTGCATGSPSGLGPGGALGMAPQTAPAAAPALPGNVPPRVEGLVPWLSALPPQEQLRTARWMLTVSDDRRLVTLFEDLRDQRDVDLEDRAATARQRLEGLVTGLERAGLRVPEAARGFRLDGIDENAPPPNNFPPSVKAEPERHADEPQAAQALEEARRTPVRPPGR
jgi:hypothetical protein